MFLRYNAFTICWALIILLLTLSPGESMPETDLWDELLSFDKVAHFFVFSLLVLLMIVGLTKQYSYELLRRKAVVYSLSVSIGYGLLIEAIQMVIPDRHFELADLLANTTGCFIGFGLFYLLYKF
ncbi:VanZ family protein [Nafulsella turpanensis]|uniref:VanZ family protein n=1 Tax=Nafulsella turpanensis TaxID=1265690 RepID=UPI0003460903|nr:VanZ family protein [Nafulsella turpanensis]